MSCRFLSVDPDLIYAGSDELSRKYGFSNGVAAEALE
jgi:hypothetical protein